ncbi:MAG: hypothetical protein M3O30_09365 [Planctomycetota bacterium]|nr:hypothetical protein [Planctomycetota bacterium]
MISTKKLGLWMAAVALMGIGAANVQAANHNINANAAGTWDKNGKHSTGRYFVGHSTQIPADTISYFVFDLSSIKGKHVTHASITVPGTNDWNFTVPWTGHNPLFQFKQKSTNMDTSRFTTRDITNGMPNPADNWKIYHYEQSLENLSYAWFPDGHTHNYEITPPRFPATLAKVQAMVNAGGNWPIFMCSGFGTTARTEEYQYTGTGRAFNQAVTMFVTTSN